MSDETSPLYEFTFRRHLADSKGAILTGLQYLQTTKVTVRAASEEAARTKARAMSGPAGTGRDSYRTWHFDLLSISEVRP